MTELRDACLGQKRIDTHSHVGDSFRPLEERAAGWETFPMVGPLIDSRVTAEGCRVLYGVDIDVGALIRPDCDPVVFERSAELYRKGPWGAVEHALDTAGIEKQLAFCGHKPSDGLVFEKEAAGTRFSYLAYIDGAINSSGQRPCPDFPMNDETGTFYSRLCEMFGPLSALHVYLDALDEAIDTWRSHGVVGMKTAIAYTSGLAISNPTVTEARAAFARRNDMTEDDFRIVHDYAFHHVLAALMRNGLPIVIHTGYQIWGHSDLDRSNPMLLHNLIVDPRYRDLTFVLLHGGNPFVGETSYLAGMFPNVVIDFTWIGWMTPARFRLALGEWLACVPHDRMCWGSDSGTPETIVGIDSVMRRLIADVLDDCLRDRAIDERYGLEFVEHLYRNTPNKVFGL